MQWGVRTLGGVAAAVALLGAATPASAQLEACGSPASAGGVLNISGSAGSSIAGVVQTAPDTRTFTFTGTIECGGADSIAIDRVELRDDSTGEVLATAGPSECSACDSTSAKGTLPAKEGRFDVVTFGHVTVGGTTYDNVRGIGQYQWFKSLNPGQQPTKVDHPSAASDCDPAGSYGYTFTPDPAGNGYVDVTAHFTCQGSARMRIEYMEAGSPDGNIHSNGGTAYCTDVDSCAQGLTDTLHIKSPNITAYRGTKWYVYANFYGYGVDGRVITATLPAQTFNWLGFGPVF